MSDDVTVRIYRKGDLARDHFPTEWEDPEGIAVMPAHHREMHLGNPLSQGNDDPVRAFVFVGNQIAGRVCLIPQTVTIGGKSPVEARILCRPWNQADMDALFGHVKNAAYEIIEGKGYTNWAIGLVISRLVDIVLDDRCSIQPVSTRLSDDYGISGVCLSLPTRVGMHGVDGHVHLHLDEKERVALEQSAGVMAAAIAEVSL